MDQKAKNADGKPNVARTATLEVDPLDAQKLALGQQVGTLSLVLRKPGEEQNNPVVETVSLDDLRYSMYGGARYRAGGNRPAPSCRARRSPWPRRRPRRRAASFAAPTAPARPKPVTNNVQIVRGTVGRIMRWGDMARNRLGGGRHGRGETTGRAQSS